MAASISVATLGGLGILKFLLGFAVAHSTGCDSRAGGLCRGQGQGENLLARVGFFENRRQFRQSGTRRLAPGGHFVLFFPTPSYMRTAQEGSQCRRLPDDGPNRTRSESARGSPASESLNVVALVGPTGHKGRLVGWRMWRTLQRDGDRRSMILLWTQLRSILVCPRSGLFVRNQAANYARAPTSSPAG